MDNRIDPEHKWNNLTRWADDVLDEYVRASEHLTDAELREREVIYLADFYTLADCWLIAHPDDPVMQRYLIEDDCLDPDMADAVVAKMKELRPDLLSNYAAFSQRLAADMIEGAGHAAE